MAFELHRNGFPAIAASAMNAQAAVALDVGDVQRQVVAPASGARVFGVALATAITAGDPVTVLDRGNVVKVTAAASLGAGQSVNILGATTSYGAVASGSWAMGQAVTGALAGEIFSLYIDPRLLP